MGPERMRGMVGPKGLPPEIRERLVKAIERSVADPEFQAKAVQFFSPLRYLAPGSRLVRAARKLPAKIVEIVVKPAGHAPLRNRRPEWQGRAPDV